MVCPSGNKRFLSSIKIWLWLLAICALCGSVQASDQQDPRDFVDTTIETLRENVIRDAVLMERDPLHTLMLVEHIVAPHIDMRFASRLMLEALASGD